MAGVDLIHPEHLVWLLLIVPLWWLARPVRPRRSLTSAHLAQWLRAREAVGRRRVRFDWLRFVLLALAVLLAVVAFARPRSAGADGPRRLAILLDASASMGAVARSGGGRTSPGVSPWSRAVAQIRACVRALPDGIDVRLVRVDDGIRVARSRAGGDDADRAVAFEELLSAPPHGVTSVRLAAMARHLQAEVEAGRIAVWTLTDALGATRAPEVGALRVVGGPLDNLAITAVDLDDGWPLPEIVVELEVANFTGRAETVSVRFVGADVARVVTDESANPGADSSTASAPKSDAIHGAAVGSAVDPTPSAPMRIGPGERASLTVRLRRLAGGTGTFELVTARRDGLAVDDRADVVLPAPPRPDVAVLAAAESGVALGAAAEALATEVGGRVVIVDPRAGGSRGERTGFLLVDGGRLRLRDDAARMLTFGTRSVASGPLTAAGLVQRPRIVDWDRTSELLEGLDLSDLRVDVALRRDFLGAGQVLIRGEHGPLMTVDERVDGSASLHCAFRLDDSNLPLLAAFPQLLRRAYARSYGTAAQASIGEGALCRAAESDLRGPVRRPADRPLPDFGTPGLELAPWLLAVAALLLVVRLYV